ncbi:MAG: GNAT family N-acetyltransferase [Bacteroidales bacterium]|nr:GNAT family N-acetyltransferase [Bacteroidales bacterium]
MINSNITFRHIEKKDNKEIADLIRTVFREFKINRPGTVYFDPTTDDLYTLFQKHGSIYWIAVEDGKIIGGCGIYATPGLPEGCSELVKLYLSSAHRGKGIGRHLLEKSIESAKKSGYSQLYLESLPELDKAIGLYEKAGFKFISGPLGNSGHFGCNIWMLLNLHNIR